LKIWQINEFSRLRKTGFLQGCEVCKFTTFYRYIVFCVHICTVQPVKAHSYVVQQTLQQYSIQSFISLF